jgi:dihydrofolate reductase
MPKVIADITMSLDGSVTGEGADKQHGLGDAPELHTWVRQQDAVDTEVLAQATAQSGAVVMGRRLFDLVNGPDGWSKDMGYGADQAGKPPFFVVTHSPRQDVRLERDLGMRFTFVSDLVTAIGQARSAATGGRRRDHGRRRHYRPGARTGPRRGAAAAPRPDGTWWRHAAVQIRDAPDVPATRSSRVAERRAPHLRTCVDRDVRCDVAPVGHRRQEDLLLNNA